MIENTLLEVISFKGYGNFGSNCTVFRLGDTCFIVDMGIEFTQDPRRYYESFVKTCKIRGFQPTFLLLTHAHADHVSFIVSPAWKHLNLPVYCSEYTKNFILNKTRGVNINTLSEFEEIQIEGIKVKTIPVDHSCKGTFAFEIEYEDKLITFLPDHKIEEIEKISKFREKPNLLFIETTNSIEEKKTESESVAVAKIQDSYSFYQKTKNNIFFCSFSLCEERFLCLLKSAIKDERRILVAGRAVVNTVKNIVASNNISYSRLHFLKNAQLMQSWLEEEDRSLIMCSGHQGEPNAALPIISSKGLIKEDDLVMFGSRTIPVKECIENRGLLLANIKRNGTLLIDNLHVSGHSSIPELKYAIKTINPLRLIPMHGDHKNLGGCIDLIKEYGIPHFLLTNGKYRKIYL